MKQLIFAIALLATTLGNAQAFSGKGDQKFQVGFNFQEFATGLNLAYDRGLGDNISIGVSTTYALDVKDKLDADFEDRFDFKARFNANIGNVINIDDNFDFYPGLSLSLKNLGGHLGARYFFSNGFGVYAEANFPLAKYKDHLDPAEELFNQFNANIGLVFDL